MSATTPYLQAVLAQTPRVLGRMDREPCSPSTGCLDRTYWAWKFTDFPGARFQEGVCALSFLYATDLETSPYYRNENLRRWIASGFDYWASIQRRAGDFDEAYPFEQSLAATAFTSFYLSEAYLFMGESLPADAASRFRTALARAAEWLMRNDESHGFLSNHLAAAAAALCHAHRIVGDVRFAARSRHFLDKILRRQSSEGWYDEYGGADPGYQTHGSFYLARIVELTGDEELERSLERSFRFLAHFIHPDASLGGEYASRNTQTYYPAAFEMMSARSGTASWIASTMRPAITSLSAAGLGTVDAYNLFPLLNNYVFAHLAAERNETKALTPDAPPTAPTVMHFPQAGLLKVRRPVYDLYVGLAKGGVVKVFDRGAGRLVFSNCGYIGRLKSGKTFSSQWAAEGRTISVDESVICVSGRFYQVSRPLLTPTTFVGFRLFSLTFGRIKRVADRLKALLVSVLIHRRGELDLEFSRRIVLYEDGIEIDDHIQGSIGDRVERLATAAVFSTIHMGSSRYFVPNELVSSAVGEERFCEPIEPSLLATGVRRRYRVAITRS